MTERFAHVAGVVLVMVVAGASCSSSSDVVVPVLPSGQQQIDVATQEDEAITFSDGAALTLGVVDYVALVSVRSTTDEKSLPQTGSVIGTIEDVYWVTHGTWNLGEYENFDGPSPGAMFRDRPQVGAAATNLRHRSLHPTSRVKRATVPAKV